MFQISLPWLYLSFYNACPRHLKSRRDLLYMHEPKEVITSKNVDILYDRVIKTDIEVGANRPDIVIKDLSSKKAFIIDVACPCDLNIHKTEGTKVAKYIGLKGQLQKMWGFKCIIIPVVVGGLGGTIFQIKMLQPKILVRSLPKQHKPVNCKSINNWYLFPLVQ